jgi:hypothetical protein
MQNLRKGEVLENQRDSSWLNMPQTVHRLSHRPIHKKRLDPGGPSEDDSQTPLLSSAMSKDDKNSKVLLAVEVEVTAVDPDGRSIASSNERRRGPWWSYIWVEFR